MISTESQSQEPFVTRENNQGWALRLKSIWDICYGCSDQPRCIYWTPFVLTTAETIYLVTDNTWRHSWGVSLTPLTGAADLKRGNYVASRQWGPSYEAIGLTGYTPVINTLLGKWLSFSFPDLGAAVQRRSWTLLHRTAQGFKMIRNIDLKSVMLSAIMGD